MPAQPQSDPAASLCHLSLDGGQAVLHLSGNWKIDELTALDAALAHCFLKPVPDGLVLDGTSLTGLDTAAALVLVQRLGQADGAALPACTGFEPRFERILGLVNTRVGAADARSPEASARWLTRFGRTVSEHSAMIGSHLAYLGLTVLALASLLRAPWRLRWRELSAQLGQTAVSAIPVICLVTFLIGLIVAYLLGLQAEQFGANIFVVDGVSLGMVREFSPLIVAVIVAGRSGAAFTAQLGTMKLTEEIDAIRTLGLSAEQVLIVPRVLALVIALPLLVFIGDLASIAGAMLVSDAMLDITPTTFVDRLHSALDLRHFVIGLAKAPIFALVIAVIGCAMGMSVSRDTRAIGINTTSTVVQSIVAVILLDAIFAILFQELEL